MHGIRTIGRASVAAGIMTAFVAGAAFAQNNGIVGSPPAIGVGIAIQRVPSGALQVGAVLPGSPAATAGVQANDLIVGIDGVDVRQIGDDQVPARLQGPRGSQVRLTVVTPGQAPRELAVTRDVLPPRPDAGPPAPQPTMPPPNGPDVPVPGMQPSMHGPMHPPGPAAQRPPVQRFRLATINDPAAGNVPAVQVLVPEGWQVQGGPVWMPDTSMAACLRLRLSDPRTGLSAEWLPVQSFTFVANPPFPMPRFGNYQGRIVLEPIGDPELFVQTFYANELRELQGLRPVGRENYPDRVQATLALMRQANVPGQPQAQAVRLRYAYTQQGMPFEADVSVILSYTQTQTGVLWDVTDAYVTRGPRGSLDANAAVLRAIRTSTQMTPIWMASLQTVRELFNQGRRQVLTDQRAMAEALAASREHTAQVARQISQDRMQSADRRAEAFRETLGGVETYKDSFQGQSVYLPAGYRDCWVNPQGEYVLSEQAGFDPNVGATTEWRKMGRQDPMNP